jgi:hypothetical protein
VESNIRKDAVTFEAVKIAMTQTKEGHVLRLAIHPNDTPEDVMRFPVGTRFQVALVALNEQGSPVAGPVTEEGNKAIRLAHVLCKDENFQKWAVREGMANLAAESAVSDGLREVLGIHSRSALKTNSEAREQLYGIAAEFRATFGKGEYKGGM